MIGADLEILHDYLIESKELLQGAQEDTLGLEADPGNDQILASIFPAFHAIKGGASFLEATHLVEWAHDLEDLLDKLRSHTLPITSARIDAILKGIDVIEQMFHELPEQKEPESGPIDLSQTIKALASLASEPAEPESEGLSVFHLRLGASGEVFSVSNPSETAYRLRPAFAYPSAA